MKDIRTLWKARAASKTITSYDLAALCIYKSLYTEEDLEATKIRLRKSFTPVKNTAKLSSGLTPYGSLRTALLSTKWTVFPTWLTEDELALITERSKLLAKEMF